jgi:hypothetical protein
MKQILTYHWILVAAIWYTVNGILHDIFVMRAHKGGYDRELLRLLMDGHVLILSGCVLFVSWQAAKSQPNWAAMTGLVVAAGMIVYCAMIFPFLKSFVTLVLSIILALACLHLRLRT